MHGKFEGQENEETEDNDCFFVSRSNKPSAVYVEIMTEQRQQQSVLQLTGHLGDDNEGDNLPKKRQRPRGSYRRRDTSIRR
jgi:hypothetical protein